MAAADSSLNPDAMDSTKGESENLLSRSPFVGSIDFQSNLGRGSLQNVDDDSSGSHSSNFSASAGSRLF